MNKIPELTLPKYAIKYAIYFVIGIVSVIFLRPFVIINPGERGVVTRLGQVQGQPLGEGLHFKAELKSDIDAGLRERLAAYGLTLTDVSITNIEFSEQFTQAIEAKQVAEQKAKQAVFIAKEAEQQAQAKINLAKGDAEAQRLQAETLKAQGGELFLKKEAIEAWKSGGAQMPQVLVTAGDSNSIPECILDLKNQKK